MASWASSVEPAMCGESRTLSRSKKGEFFERLLTEDVEGRAGDLAGLEGFGERLVDDELAASAIDNADALLHDARAMCALIMPSV